jgi:tetratricopeptide (TPR) repeat protein
MVVIGVWNDRSVRCPRLSNPVSKPSIGGFCGGVLLILLAAFCPLARAADSQLASQPPSESLARSIAETALDFGLNLTGPPTTAQRDYLAVMFDAALRLDPKLPMGLRAKFELARMSDDPQAMTQAIEAWFNALPDHAGLADRWIDLKYEDWHTSEERERGLLKLVANPTLADYVKGLAYVRMAQLAAERVDDDRCTECLDRAFSFMSDHPDAVMARFNRLSPEMPANERLKAALHLLSLNPVHVEAAWEAALALQDVGLAERAAPFFDHARQVYRIVRPSALIPAAYHVHLAENYLARGRLPAAIASLRAALSLDPRQVDTAFLLMWSLEEAELLGAVEQLSTTLAERFARIHDPARWPVEEVLHAAWYHILIDPQPERALMLAKSAQQRVPQDVRATRILGFAQAAGGDLELATQTLSKIAQRDIYAGVWLAEQALQANDLKAAGRWFEPFEQRYPVGELGQRVNALRSVLAPPPPPETKPEPVTADPNQPASADAEAVSQSVEPLLTKTQQAAIEILAKFNMDRLRFYQDPGAFITFNVRFADPTRAPSEPWWVEITISNRSEAAFAIGPDGAFNPIVSLSVELTTDVLQSFPNLRTVTFDESHLLPPGETLRRWLRLDIGPLHSLLRRNPRSLIRVGLASVLDPTEDAGGGWVPGFTGQQLAPVYLSRAPFVPSTESIDLLIRQLQSDDRASQILALSQMAALLGEQQRARMNPNSPQPPPIPTDRLATAIRGALEADQAELRAAALLALDACGLDSYLFEAVQRCEDHGQWVVRMLALRVLARQGEAAVGRLRTIASDDADSIVRRMAAALHRQIAEKASTSQPLVPADE